MCEHLIALENDIKAKGIKETYRGTPWSMSCREWVYFDCLLDLHSLRIKYQLPEFVVNHSNDDIKSGLEAGFICTHCDDAIMGLHRDFGKEKIIFQ